MITIKRFSIVTLTICIAISLTDGDGVRLPDQQSDQQLQQPLNDGHGNRQGKHLLDFVGLGTGSNTDPYLARTNGNCLNGELAECFKSQALGTFNDFFNKDFYILNGNVRVIRTLDSQQRSLDQDPFEFSSEPRADDSEWDHLLKFALRKVERFVKSAAIEVNIPEEVTDGGRFAPRFISDEISDEIDIIEDKKAPLFSRKKLKKLILPLLIILKLFKLKLLLFLPLILGLAGFKKVLGFLAIIIPGVIGYFKLCRPEQNFGPSNYFTGQQGFAHYSPQGVGAASYHQHSHFPNQNQYSQYRPEPHFAKPYGDFYRNTDQSSSQFGSGDNGNGIRFGEVEHPQDLAYNGFGEYRNKKQE